MRCPTQVPGFATMPLIPTWLSTPCNWAGPASELELHSFPRERVPMEGKKAKGREGGRSKISWLKDESRKAEEHERLQSFQRREKDNNKGGGEMIISPTSYP